ncbi:T9SS type A sorting domain-containing protein [Odoribacter sp. OttesenSCG-928-L07]|nr:T9SS type A sorting domain-containing protein [Odoribacter sp. OttesenSCG-928-L07]
MRKNLLLIVMVLLTGALVAQNKVSRQDGVKPATKIQLSGFETPTNQSDATFVPFKNGGYTFIEENGIKETNIGQTVYDWQTNSSARNQVVFWEDGWVSATFTQTSEANYANRGSAYAYYDGTSWHASEGRVETQRTGFGSIARYGENGVVIAAHGGSDIIVSICEDRIGSSWREVVITTEGAWPSVMTSGENNEIIHVIAVDQDVAATTIKGGNLLYYRSKDGGLTWDMHEHVIEFVGPAYILDKFIGSNSYYFMETTSADHPYCPNRLSFVLSDGGIDGQVIYSDNDGDSWNRTIFFENPFPLTSVYDMYMYPRWPSAAWDKDGYLHVAYEFNRTNHDGAGLTQYQPGLGGVAYWNEDMQIMDTTYIESIFSTGWFYSDATGPMPNEYMGYLVPLANGVPVNTDPSTWAGTTALLDHGKYNCGIVGMPSIAIDYDTDMIYVVYISSAEGFSIDDLDYFRIFARASQDYGQTWSDVEMLTKGPLHMLNECVYPHMSNKLLTAGKNKLHVIYQQDMYPGSYVQDEDPDAFDNYYFGITVNLIDFNSVKDYEGQAAALEMNVYPNPASTYANIYLDNEAQINVYNSVGQAVKSFKHNGGNVDMDVQSFKPGVYMVVANSGSASTSIKLIVK